MKFNKSTLRILLFAILFLQASSFAQDIKLKIPATTINNALGALTNAKYFSYGSTGGGIVSYYSLKVQSASVSLGTNNSFTMNAVADFVANFDLGPFDFEYVFNGRNISLSGTVNISAIEGGYKVILTPTLFSSTNGGVFDEVLNSTSGILPKLPEICLNVNQPMFTSLLSTYFTSSVPEIKTDASGIELGFTLKAGPRYITFYNSVESKMDIGFIQVKNDALTYDTYKSPATMEVYTGQSATVQTPSDVLDGTAGKYKYKNWWRENKGQIKTDIAPRRIQITAADQDESYKAQFNEARNIILTNDLEGIYNGGTVTYDATTGSTINYYDYFDGDQTHPISSSVPNGTLGRNWYFYEWSDGNTQLNRSVILNQDKNLKARYKSTHISNKVSALDNSGQSKIYRDGNVNYLVYESMNKIWIESSTDKGATWSLENGYKPINTSPSAGTPAVDGTESSDHYKSVVFVERNTASNSCKVLVAEMSGGNVDRTKDASLLITGSTYECQPAVAWSLFNNNLIPGNVVVVIWRQPEEIPQWMPAGLYYRIGTMTSSAEGIIWSDYPTYIPGTDVNSWNPSVVGLKSNSSSIPGFHVAYTQKIGSQSVIKYVSISANTAGIVTAISTPLEISPALTMDEYHINPSITLVNNNPFVGWTYYNSFLTTQGAAYRGRTLANNGWGTTNCFIRDENVISTHIKNIGNINSGYKDYAFGWSLDYGNGQYIKSTSASTIYNTSTTGSRVQVSGGSTFGDAYLLSYVNATLPYSFQSSSPMASTAPQAMNKTITGDGETEEAYMCREKHLRLNDAVIKTGLGDLLVDNSPIKFSIQTDSSLYTSEGLSKALETEVFDVTDNSIVSYSLSVNCNDSVKLGKALDNSSVSFSLELIDVSNGNTIKKLSECKFDKNSIMGIEPANYSLNINGIGNRKVKLRMNEVNNFSDTVLVERKIVNSFVSLKNMMKKNKTNVVLSLNDVVKNYALEQNYPNPFNPSTVIRYQIPEAGRVTLKVYDVLGREVISLVDEFKEKGRYEAVFNASSLSSGTYIYKIQVNEYSSTRKMMLVK